MDNLSLGGHVWYQKVISLSLCTKIECQIVFYRQKLRHWLSTSWGICMCALSAQTLSAVLLSSSNGGKIWIPIKLQDNGNQKEFFDLGFQIAVSIHILRIRVWNLVGGLVKVLYIRISGLILANRLMGWLYCRYNSWLYLDFEHRQTSTFSTFKTFAV